MRRPTLHLLLAAALAAAAGPAAAEPPRPAAGKPGGAAPAPEYVEKGVRFRLPGGWPVTEQEEAEPGGDEDTVYVARQGPVEVRVEVEDGLIDCTEILDTRPRPGKNQAGLETCEAEARGPPMLGAQVKERSAAMVSVQFPGRHLSVIVFAPARATAIEVARRVAASGAEVR